LIYSDEIGQNESLEDYYYAELLAIAHKHHIKPFASIVWVQELTLALIVGSVIDCSVSANLLMAHYLEVHVKSSCQKHWNAVKKAQAFEQ